MSKELVMAAFDAPNVKGTDKFVLIALAKFASDETCSCRPSLQDLADVTGLGKKTVFRALESLEEAGVVLKVSRGNGRACEFSLRFERSETDVKMTTVPDKTMVKMTTVSETDVKMTTVPDKTMVKMTTVPDCQEEEALLKENLPPTPPIRENNLSQEEKETPQTPRESQGGTTQLDLWGNPIAEPAAVSEAPSADYPQDILDMFGEFWEQYPLKENRESALKVFAKLLKPKADKRAFMDTMLASIERERKSTRWQKGEYVSPAEWLKGNEWCLAKFAEFWERYPRKVAKGDALRAFKKLVANKQDVDWFMRIVMDSLDRWAKSPQWTKDGGKFIPYPATWLNRGSWEDSKEKDCTQKKATFLNSRETDEELLRRAGLI